MLWLQIDYREPGEPFLQPVLAVEIKMRILLTERYPLLNFAIRKLIEEKFPAYRIFSTAFPIEAGKNGKERYDVIILPVSRLDTSKRKRELIRTTATAFPGSKIVLFENDLPSYQDLPSYLKEGIWGYISLTGSPENLINCLNNLASGIKYIGREVLDLLLDNIDKVIGSPSGYTEQSPKFTVTELGVARDLVRGKKVSVIARESGRKASTISTIKKKVMQKARVDNVIALKEVLDLI